MLSRISKPGLLFLLVFLMASCTIADLFKPKYDACSGEDKTLNEVWHNPELYSTSPDNLVGHTKKTDEKIIFYYGFGIDKVCTGDPIEINFIFTYLDKFSEIEGLEREDIKTSGYLEVWDKNNDQQLYRQDLSISNFFLILEDREVIGLASKVEDEIVNLSFVIEISFPWQKLELCDENCEYYFYDIIEELVFSINYYQ